MPRRYQFTLIENEDHFRCYVWAVDAHGTGTRRRILTTVHVPLEDGMSPAAVLQAVASELEKPLLERWMPRRGSASPGGS